MVEFDAQPQIVLQPRAGVGVLVEACARKQLSFDELCGRVAAMGYKTTSLFEMVRGVEEMLKERETPKRPDGHPATIECVVCNVDAEHCSFEPRFGYSRCLKHDLVPPARIRHAQIEFVVQGFTQWDQKT